MTAPLFDRCRWINEPARWQSASGVLTVATDHASDFWRLTHYGFIRHSGHVFGYAVSGGFTASLRVRASYQALYDQAGIMVLADDANWIKAGIEMSDGEAWLSSVLTQGQSDWARGAFPGDPSDVWIRVTIDAGVLRLQVSADGQRWPLVRLCPFPAREGYIVGPMCCTPERAGLAVEFSDFTVGPPSAKDLHDLT